MDSNAIPALSPYQWRQSREKVYLELMLSDDLPSNLQIDGYLAKNKVTIRIVDKRDDNESIKYKVDYELWRELKSSFIYFETEGKLLRVHMLKAKPEWWPQLDTDKMEAFKYF